jgi:hypothetical protein
MTTDSAVTSTKPRKKRKRKGAQALPTPEGLTEEVVAQALSEGSLAEFMADPAFEQQVTERVQSMLVGREAQKRFATQVMEERNTRVTDARQVAGDTFLLDVPNQPPILWGGGEQALWIGGEGTLIVGGDGVGKTTLAQQLALSRVGMRDLLLDFPVQKADGRVLYLAMDRPAQAQRSFARMVATGNAAKTRRLLRDRLVVWRGPLPVDLLTAPDTLANWIHEEFGDDVSDVFVDSVKDLAPGLNDDTVGAGLNIAMQEVLARGINWLALHHQRKANSTNLHPNELSDVYGSRWLTAGMGSVFMVVGKAGDQTVELRQLKEPLRKVPPLLVHHDHRAGHSTVVERERLPEEVLADAGDEGITVKDFAREVWGDDNRATEQKASRTLKKMKSNGKVCEIPAKSGGKGGSTPARYVAVGGEA